MNTRIECSFIIPVLPTTTTIKTFCQRGDQYHSMIIAEKISCLVNHTGLFTNKINLLFFKELVKNAYDAYAISGLSIGESLNIKVIIEKNNHQVCIKIKDNGGGFIDHQKGACFTRSEIRFQNKGYDLGFTGGQRVGLKVFENNIKAYHGSVYYKNRKNKGATVTLFFKSAPPCSSLSSPAPREDYRHRGCNML